MRAVLLVALAVLAAGCNGPLGGASLDEPSFVVEPASGDGATLFKVDAGRLGDGMKASWDFGDGSVAEGRTAEHAYGFTNGMMTITLVLTKDGEQAVATREVKLGTGKNANPSASLSASPRWVEVGKVVNLDARPSDADKDPLRVTWSYREAGKPEIVALEGANKTTVTFDHPGRFDVTVKVRDPKGAETVRNASVDVSTKIPASTALHTWNGTLVAGTAGQGLAEKAWTTPAPDPPATFDSARHAYTLEYPASTFVMLTWNDTSQQGAFDLDMELRDDKDQTIFKDERRAPAPPFELNFTEQLPGTYTVIVRAVAGARVEYTLTVQAALRITPELVNKGSS